MLLKETFTDELKKHVRRQETHFYMEPMNVILQLASKTGFIPKGQLSMEPFSHDKYQQLVIFERAQ